MSLVQLPRPRRVLSSTDELCDALGIDFSDEQLAAITAPLTPAVIIAGAGSGKTTVMAARVVWLVGTGQVAPHEVLGLTFTRKAAAELAHRVRQALEKAGVLEPDGEDADGEEVIMTYDSFAARLVNEHGLRIGVETDPMMLTGASRYRLASRVVSSAGGPFEHISRLRPASVTERVLKLDADMASHLVRREQVVAHSHEFVGHLEQAPRNNRGNVYAAVGQAGAAAMERVELLDLVDGYQQLKRELGLVEFADQMAVAAELVQRVPGVSAAVRDRFRVVLLDEYQDTSSAQAQLLHGLFSGSDPQQGRGHAVTAVGDPFQAIYGWRGAAASNILQFSTEFAKQDGSPADSYTLSVNRRSGQKILDVANDVAATLRDDPLLVRDGHEAISLVAPPGKDGGAVRAATFETWPQEVAWIADQVVTDGRNATDPSGQPQWSRIAVLVRRNADIASIFSALVDRDVPVEIVGLGGLLRLPEVADVVATLTLVNDVTANPEAVRLLTGPRWHVGERDLALLGQRAVELSREVRPERPESPDLYSDLADAIADVDPAEVVCLLDAAENPGPGPFSDQARERFAAFTAELADLRQHADEPITELVRRVVHTLGLDVELSATEELARTNRRSQLATFVDAVAEYVDVDGDASLGGLLAWLDAELDHGAGLDQATPSERNSVKLLTVHRSKGLEWDVVYLPALVEGVFPSDRVTDNWTKNAAVLPAELRGDADSIPQLADASNAALTDYGKELKLAQRRSEDRLAYVAITRAREQLTATGHTWRPGLSRPRKPATYLASVMAEADRQGQVLATAPPVAEQNPAAAPQARVEWPIQPDPDARERRLLAAELVEGARERFAQTGSHEGPAEQLTLDQEAAVARWDAEMEQLLAEARGGDRAVVEVPMPSALSASALMSATRDPEGFAASLVRPMPRRVSAAATLGTRFHEWVERRFGMATLVDPDDWPATDLTESDLALHRLVRAFEQGPYADRQPVAVEVPFVLVLGESLLRGRMDAVYAAEPGSGHDFQVVDWKTANQPSDPTQLAIYRLAWAQARKVPLERVDAVFYHVLSGEVERPAQLADEQELVRMAHGGSLPDLPGPGSL
ncbi:UvrD-helicase domain-containing protein [Luteococcus sp. OSA5]|uniref:UvrD-helicase domain-containing protein n=1 Tax=Luteococcus sp. OSA5 TaxID=3401630 RepID=UPI003B42AFD1